MTNKNHEIISKEGINFLVKKSTIFQDILNKYGRPPAWEREPGFETLIKIILEQQVSLESAKASFYSTSTKYWNNKSNECFKCF